MNDMNKDDEDVMSKIRVLREETAPEHLYERIMTVVPNLPQVRAQEPRAAGFSLVRFFGQWNYALGVKFAALALVAVVGFYAGHAGGAPHENGFSAIVTGDIGWED
ncbi:MAG: hypothetical protein GC185_00225 [Alphaproteobacteria bacterium]|nr:hypothetical protein [Alphaproteobacteria bacterium]